MRYMGTLIVLTAMVLMTANTTKGETIPSLLSLDGTAAAASNRRCPPPPPPPPPRSKRCPPCPHDDCRDRDHDKDHDKDHRGDTCGKGNDSNLP
jgi:hypothetical protein